MIAIVIGVIGISAAAPKLAKIPGIAAIKFVA